MESVGSRYGSAVQHVTDDDSVIEGVASESNGVGSWPWNDDAPNPVLAVAACDLVKLGVRQISPAGRGCLVRLHCLGDWPYIRLNSRLNWEELA